MRGRVQEMSTTATITLQDTINRRAMAGLVVALDVEVASRRDTKVNHHDHHVYQLVRRSFETASLTWNQLEPSVSPVEYVSQWDNALLYGGLDNDEVQSIIASLNKAVSRMAGTMSDVIISTAPAKVAAPIRDGVNSMYSGIASSALAAA
jgi:hypothetical protein